MDSDTVITSVIGENNNNNKKKAEEGGKKYSKEYDIYNKSVLEPKFAIPYFFFSFCFV